jgi:hypothetical protein
MDIMAMLEARGVDPDKLDEVILDVSDSDVEELAVPQDKLIVYATNCPNLSRVTVNHKLLVLDARGSGNLSEVIFAAGAGVAILDLSGTAVENIAPPVGLQKLYCRDCLKLTHAVIVDGTKEAYFRDSKNLLEVVVQGELEFLDLSFCRSARRLVVPSGEVQVDMSTAGMLGLRVWKTGVTQIKSRMQGQAETAPATSTSLG